MNFFIITPFSIGGWLGRKTILKDSHFLCFSGVLEYILRSLKPFFTFDEYTYKWPSGNYQNSQELENTYTVWFHYSPHSRTISHI